MEKQWREKQRAILATLLGDKRLLGSAKNHVRLMLDLLADDDTVGFDTTSALFYSFLQNPDFTDPAICPLSQSQLVDARANFRSEAQISRAKESALLRKVSRLPLASFFGHRMDLKDLAVAFLTYASEERFTTFDSEIAAPLYKYLRIPRDIFPNVYDLYYSLQYQGVSYHDLIISLSRLKLDLVVPDNIKAISIGYERLFDQVSRGLPRSLSELDGAGLEDFIMEAYERAGFLVVRIGRLATSPDGGVDIIATSRDETLWGDLRFAIQCKVTSNKIDADLVRGFNGVLGNFKAHKGVFVAKSGFTRTAVLETKAQMYPIELMDYVRLTNSVRDLVLKS